MTSSRINRNYLLFLAIFLAVSLPRMLSLKQSVVVDESKWLVRSANFMSAISSGSFADTYQREHPGVTTMWAGTLGLAWLIPEYKDAGTTNVDRVQFISILQQSGYEPLEALVSARVFVVLLNSTVLLFVFAYAQKLLGTAGATLGILFIAFSPFHAAHTQILHLDGLLGSFMLLSLMAFLNFESYRRLPDLLVSGIAAGLSWLTKSPSLVLIPTIGILALVFYWHRIRSRDGITLKTLRPVIISLISWAAIAGLTFFLLWPAMWIDPLDSVTKVITSAMGYASQGHDLAVFFDGQIFPEGRIGPEYFYFYPLSYLWRSSPIVLVGLPLSLIAFFRRDYPLHRFQSRIMVAGLLLSVVIFLLAMNFGTKKFDRYLIPAYAPLDLISATGWIAFSVLIANKVKRSQPRRLVMFSVLGTTILFQFLLLLSVFPYYLSYYNVIIGGSKRVPEVMTVGWGEGLDAAARYLNEKPSPDSLRVASWYRNSFLFHFEGQTDDIPGFLDQPGLDKIFEADYVVIYIHQWQRELPKILLDQLRDHEPEHRVWINGLEYARIYNLNDVNVESN